MSKRFGSQSDIDEFLSEPRLAILMYNGKRPAPTGVPVWFDWNGHTLQMFAGRTSPKVGRLQQNPSVSVLITNRVGEPEGWVAFDGTVTIGDFAPADWEALIDRVAPRYRDMSMTTYANEISNWRSTPEAFVSLTLVPEAIRSGA